nr:pentatricopeptide repeat protein AaPPR559 [Agave angustifolia]UPT49455.1 pentatricopeptide repeat protein AaPPR516 [Agave angustifolia]
MMGSEGVKPDLYAITSVLHACACNGFLDQGNNVHDFVARNALESHLFVADASMDMYAKHGDMEAARVVFDCTTRKDIVSWNTIIGGYSKNCLLNEALNLFSEMQSYLRPNSVTLACVLLAAASLSSFEKGR